MSQKSTQCAVLILVFNRPDFFLNLINRLREIAPVRIYVAADGPRAGHAKDLELCTKTRSLVSQIDWHCEVRTRFSDINLGLKYGPSSGIRWFFENEAEGIILEDDCQPSPQFILFCNDMLKRYRNCPKVMHIAGSNMGAPASAFGGYGYAFASIPLIWGWATWRRALVDYQVDIKAADIPNRSEFVRKGISLPHAHAIYTTLLKVVSGKIITWDFQLSLTILKARGLCIVPRANLITNVGFGPDATTTKDASHFLANRDIQPMNASDWLEEPKLEEGQKLNAWLALQIFGNTRKLTWRLIKYLVRGR